MIAPLAALIACSWLALLVTAPLMPSPFSAPLYVVGAFICHQLPDRSFHLAGFQLPVCARCLGLYAGAAVGAMWCQIVFRRDVRRRDAAPVAGLSARTALMWSAAPIVVTLALEAVGVWKTSNVARALTGLPLGAVVGVVVVRALATLHYDECAPRRPTANSQSPRPPI